jgi:two-component system alkaline phosphatase synthesis response regulator PhoP
MLQVYEANPGTPPCLILAHPDAGYEAAIGRGFRRLGWDVYVARSGPEARRLVRMLEADVVILDAELPQESGWLTCDKLKREQPLVQVILVSDNLSPRNHELAAFVGASALVSRTDSLAPLVEELRGPAVPAAG